LFQINLIINELIHSRAIVSTIGLRSHGGRSSPNSDVSLEVQLYLTGVVGAPLDSLVFSALAPVRLSLLAALATAFCHSAYRDGCCVFLGGMFRYIDLLRVEETRRKESLEGEAAKTI
jgi:hypothetical protein